MLLRFKLKNFKVFKELAVLDLTAAGLSEHVDTHLIQSDKLVALKSAAIYGKNAAGKSKFIQGLEFMREFVIDSSKDRQSNDRIEVDAFRLNTQSKEAPSYFEIEFVLDGNKYRYGFEATHERVEKEWLFESKKTKEYPLFLRLLDDFQIDAKRFEEGKEKEKWTRKNALFLSLVAQLNGALSQKIIDWFDKLRFAHHVCDCEDDWSLAHNYLGQESFRERIVEILKNADVDIEDIELIKFEEVRSKKTGKKIEPEYPDVFIKTYHKVFNEDQEEAGEADFDLFEDESDGTIRLLNLICIFLNALDEGLVVFADELDTRLHPHLVQALVQQFNTIANKKAQLIFTTHDSNLLDRKLLRRDQIYFVEKDRFGASKLYSLAEFKVRKDVNYEINYLSGRYGAIPFIHSLNPERKHAPKEAS